MVFLDPMAPACLNWAAPLQTLQLCWLITPTLRPTVSIGQRRFRRCNLPVMLHPVLLLSCLNWAAPLQTLQPAKGAGCGTRTLSQLGSAASDAATGCSLARLAIDRMSQLGSAASDAATASAGSGRLSLLRLNWAAPLQTLQLSIDILGSRALRVSIGQRRFRRCNLFQPQQMTPAHLVSIGQRRFRRCNAPIPGPPVLQCWVSIGQRRFRRCNNSINLTAVLAKRSQLGSAASDAATGRIRLLRIRAARASQLGSAASDAATCCETHPSL